MQNTVIIFIWRCPKLIGLYWCKGICENVFTQWTKIHSFIYSIKATGDSLSLSPLFWSICSLSLFGLALSLARNESVSQPTHFACAYTKKGNTHTRTHIQRTRTHRKWGRTFFGRFLHVYTYVYSIYIYIYILICLNTYQICHCCFYCVLIIIIHTHTHTDTYLFISINYIFNWYYLRDVANCLQRHVRWLLFHFLH